MSDNPTMFTADLEAISASSGVIDLSVDRQQLKLCKII